MGVKISELNEATSAQNSDVLPIVQNEETKKISVETLGSQKVNKSGDTLTGRLLFENKNDYDTIRKTRTIDGTDYQLTVGLGGNGSARMEFVKVPDNVLSSVEARSDGIYNGKTNKKLAEQSNGWTDATKTSAIEGIVKYTKIGNIVIVIFDDIKLKSNITAGTILASGLPIATSSQRTVLDNYEAPSRPIRVGISTSGQIVSHYTTQGSSNENHYGTLIYITNQYK